MGGKLGRETDGADHADARHSDFLSVFPLAPYDDEGAGFRTVALRGREADEEAFPIARVATPMQFVLG
jgi:hypothetical protein